MSDRVKVPLAMALEREAEMAISELVAADEA
jgi:hypothetical protein